jgi:hypothetical protein
MPGMPGMPEIKRGSIMSNMLFKFKSKYSLVKVYEDKILFDGHSSYKSKSLVKRVIEMPLHLVSGISFVPPTFSKPGKIIIENPYIDGFNIRLRRGGKYKRLARQMVETVERMKNENASIENDKPGYKLSIIILNKTDLYFGQDNGAITISRMVQANGEENYIYSTENGQTEVIDITDEAMRRITEPLRKGQVLKILYGEHTLSKNPRLFRMEYTTI